MLTSCLTFFVVIGDAEQAALWIVIVKSLVAFLMSCSVFRLILSRRLFRTFSWNNPQSVLLLYNDGFGLLYITVVLIVPMMWYDLKLVKDCLQ